MVPIIVLLTGILCCLLLALLLQKWLKSPGALPRKVLHIGAISLCAFSVILVDEVNTVFWVTLASIPLLTAAVYFNAFKDHEQGRRSWGIVHFALAFALLQYLFAREQPWLVYYPMLILALADGLATLVGMPFGKRSYTLGGDTRSLLGSTVFFITTMGVLAFGHLPIAAQPLYAGHSWVALVFIAVFITLAEAVSSRGRDNLWIPLAAAYWLLLSPVDTPLLWLGLIGIPLLAYLAWRRSWLDAGGAASACLMGWILLLSPEALLMLPALIFFIVGTAWSLLPQKKQQPGHTARSKAQVLANGGVPVLGLMAYFAFGWEAGMWAYVAGMAAALSDTSASELGTRLSGRSYAILGGRKLPAGASGGISLWGTTAGLAMAVPIPLALWFTGHLPLQGLYLLAAVGFVANIVDSLMGQWIQRKYVMPDGSWTDEAHPGAAQQEAGWRNVNNDMVNAICTAFAALLGASLYYL